MTPDLNQKSLNYNKCSWTVIIITLSSLYYSGLLFADNYHSHEQIRSTAIEFVRSKIPENVTIKEIKVGQIDARVRFKQCSQALEATSTMKKRIASNWTVGIRCIDTPSWSINLPVRARLMRMIVIGK